MLYYHDQGSWNENSIIILGYGIVHVTLRKYENRISNSNQTSSQICSKFIKFTDEKYNSVKLDNAQL